MLANPSIALLPSAKAKADTTPFTGPSIKALDSSPPPLNKPRSPIAPPSPPPALVRPSIALPLKHRLPLPYDRILQVALSDALQAAMELVQAVWEEPDTSRMLRLHKRKSSTTSHRQCEHSGYLVRRLNSMASMLVERRGTDLSRPCKRRLGERCGQHIPRLQAHTSTLRSLQPSQLSVHLAPFLGLNQPRRPKSLFIVKD